MMEKKAIRREFGRERQIFLSHARFFPLSFFPLGGSELLFNRGSYEITPFSPGSVVVPDIGVAQQILQDKPSVGRPLSDPAVGYDFLVRSYALWFRSEE